MVLSFEPLSHADVVDGATGLLRPCKDICSARAQCECIDGVANGKELEVDSVSSAVCNESVILTFLTDQRAVDAVQLSLLDGVVPRKTRSVPIEPMRLASRQTVELLLRNALELDGIAQKASKQRIVLKVSSDEKHDALLMLEAVPLNDATRIRSCRIKSQRKCSVLVDAALDYSVKVWNRGLVAQDIKLFSHDAKLKADAHSDVDLSALFAGQDTARESSASQFGHYRHEVGALFVLILVLIFGFAARAILQQRRKEMKRRIAFSVHALGI